MDEHEKETSLHFSDFPYTSQGLTSVLERKLSTPRGRGREESRLIEVSHPYSPAERGSHLGTLPICVDSFHTFYPASSMCQVLYIKISHHFASEELRLSVPKIASDGSSDFNLSSLTIKKPL